MTSEGSQSQLASFWVLYWVTISVQRKPREMEGKMGGRKGQKDMGMEGKESIGRLKRRRRRIRVGRKMKGESLVGVGRRRDKKSEH